MSYRCTNDELRAAALEWKKAAENLVNWLNGQDKKAAERFINSLKERFHAQNRDREIGR